MSKSQEILSEVVLDGASLTVEQVVAASRGKLLSDGTRSYPKVRLAPEARAHVGKIRAYIEENWLKADAPAVYGFNTGVGPLKNLRIPPKVNDQFQRNLAVSHAAGLGDPAPEEVVRASIVLVANVLVKGESGVRPEHIDRLLDMVNAGIHPIMPTQGSVGASGDLGPMSHVSIVMMGHPESEAFYKGERMPARKAFALAGLSADYAFKGREALSIASGCSFALAYGVLALYDAWQVLHCANLACAMSMEGLRGEKAAFDPRVHKCRNHPGQIAVAAEILHYLEGSQWAADAGRQVKLPNDKSDEPWEPRVQDAYALRCAPQVNGAAWDLLEFAEKTMEREMNGALDNPLTFPTEDGKSYEALSGGNFHGQQIAFATDMLAMGVHEIGNISDRRSSRQLDPALNFGLPRNLVGAQPGVNTGFTVTQNTATALVMENRTLVTPTSTDSIPNKSNQEDHISQATWSARKARIVVENVFKIIGIEFLCACQAMSLIENSMGTLPLGETTSKVYALFRQTVPMVVEDRYMSPLIWEAVRLTRSGELLERAGHSHLN